MFKFLLREQIKINKSSELGLIIGRTEYADGRESEYLILVGVTKTRVLHVESELNRTHRDEKFLRTVYDCGVSGPLAKMLLKHMSHDARDSIVNEITEGY